MTDPAGGFYSTEDADSEGEEGLFYTWTPDEIEAVLGEERGGDVRPRVRRDATSAISKAATFSICRRRSSSVRRF